jgi:hypothetical protein
MRYELSSLRHQNSTLSSRTDMLPCKNSEDNFIANIENLQVVATIKF